MASKYSNMIIIVYYNIYISKLQTFFDKKLIFFQKNSLQVKKLAEIIIVV